MKTGQFFFSDSSMGAKKAVAKPVGAKEKSKKEKDKKESGKMKESGKEKKESGKKGKKPAAQELLSFAQPLGDLVQAAVELEPEPLRTEMKRTHGIPFPGELINRLYVLEISVPSPAQNLLEPGCFGSGFFWKCALH